MNILVTGGSGFIGTRLVSDLLDSGHQVTIYDKVISNTYPDITVQGDVRDLQALTKACQGIELIYNLAAEHADNVTPLSLYGDVNIGGAENVVKAAEANGIQKVIFTSSVAIYGLNRGEPDETFEPQPFNEYGRSKLGAEKVFLKWYENDQNNSLIMLRPCVIFGENNRGNVYNLISQIANGKFLMVGNGQNRKSMAYVGNISAFLASLADKHADAPQIYNFAGKPDLTSNEIVRIIKNELGIEKGDLSAPYWLGLLGGYAFDLLTMLTGKKFPVSSVRIKKFTAETTVNTDRLAQSGFTAPYSLEEGLRRMIRHEFK
jgi:GlcNAc-P-P-Und epimerase